MTVTLRPVGRDDVGPLHRLTVADHQARFVAPNAVTLAQAPFEGGSSVFVILADAERVVLLAAIDMRAHDHREVWDDPDSLYLWRLMIGAAHQRQGHGRAAMARFLDLGRALGLPRASLSVVEANADGRAFYEALGFVDTGRVEEGERSFTREL